MTTARFIPSTAYDCWSDPATELYNNDCRQVIFPPVDLVFADPPFNIGEPYADHDDNLPLPEYRAFTEEWMRAASEVLRPGVAFWINIPDQHAAHVVLQFERLGYEMRNWCIWHYRFGQNRSSRFISSKTHLLYFVKPGGERTWNSDAILVPSDRASKYNDPRTRVKADGGKPGLRVPLDVWCIENDGPNWGRVTGGARERRPLRPNQMPERLLQRVILACSNEGDLVLDPFAGSGTTLVVARALRRRSIGVEISSRACASIRERIAAGATITPSKGDTQ